VNLPTLHLIEDPGEFAALLQRLRTELLVAVDTEAASFHRYRDRVYLIQLSTRTETHLVDPLTVPGLSGFGELLADPVIEKVFHDADYDLRLLGYEFGFSATNLFDTRVAAQFLNEAGIGLAALLEKYIGVRPDKRFQRADWSARPLTQPMLEYAAMDTRHLPDLRDLMKARLIARGRLDWVLEECALLTTVRWPVAVPPEEAALGVKGVRALTPRAQAVFRELYVWRARTSEMLDRAAFRVMGNEALLALAQQPPADQAALAGVKGVGREMADRRGAEILAAIRRGLGLPDADLPRMPRGLRQRPDPAFDARLDRLKALRAGLAAREDLAPGVLCPNWLLEAIARAAPTSLEELSRVEGIRRWQVGAIGSDLLKAVPGQ
jgi:ribonuclease D